MAATVQPLYRDIYLLDEYGMPLLFGLLAPDADFPPLGGVFAFMKVDCQPDHPDGAPGDVRITGPFFVGITDRFSDRRALRARWDEAVGSYGATHIATRHITGKPSQRAEARSLVFKYDPPMRNRALITATTPKARPEPEYLRLVTPAGHAALLYKTLANPIVFPQRAGMG